MPALRLVLGFLLPGSPAGSGAGSEAARRRNPSHRRVCGPLAGRLEDVQKVITADGIWTASGLEYAGTVVDLPVSKKQIDRLGDRLRDADVPDEADLSLLESVLACYDEVLEQVGSTLRELGHEPTVRTKTTGTLIDKLRRNRNSSLKTIQDLAGARIVIAGRASDQDQICGELVERFRTDDYEPGIDDRRSTPSAGYRAVHVIVRVEGLPAEIQVRTELQDLWAQIFERLGDAWGRQIRYGGSPDSVDGSPSRNDLRAEVMVNMADMSRQISVLEKEQDLFQEWPPVHGDDISEGGQGWELVKLAKRHVEILQELEDSVRKSLDIISDLIEEEEG